MATFTRIKVKKQSCGRMLGALAYVLQGIRLALRAAEWKAASTVFPTPAIWK
jgi:hypothetical protein